MADSDPGVDIDMLGNGSTQLTFLDAGLYLPIAIPLITTVLDKSRIIAPIDCMYALSGQYDHFPRYLFYVCIITAWLGRHFTGLADIALGLIMTYSATACVHLFVLLGYYSFSQLQVDPGLNKPEGYFQYLKQAADDGRIFGDIDFWGIAPVVAVSTIAMVPVLGWSSTFRMQKSGKKIAICWAFLIFATFVTVNVLLWRWGSSWTVDIVPSFAVCDKNCSSLTISDTIHAPLISTIEDYSKCNCFDFCGAVSPKAPLRTGQAMVPLLAHKMAEKMLCKDSSCERLNRNIVNLETALQILWLFALLEGFLALSSAISTPENVRHYLFRFFNTRFRNSILSSSNDQPKEKAPYQETVESGTLYRRIRRLLAKTIAAVYYAASIFSIILSPPTLIISIVVLEIQLGTISTSEHTDAVGAWTPWVAAGFAISASLVDYYDHWISQVAKSLSRLMRRDGTRFDGPDSGPPEKTCADAGGDIMDCLRDLKEHGATLWESFRYWWNHPESLQKDGPKCKCSKCHLENTNLRLPKPQNQGLVEYCATNDIGSQVKTYSYFQIQPLHDSS